jgi:ABC-2 type transport system permease protein
VSFANDLRAVMWKESRELLRQRTTLVSAAFMLAIFGVVLPVQGGASSLRSLSALPGFLIIPFATIVAFIADAFAGERERHTLESLLATRLSDRAILAGKILVAVAYGWGLVLAKSVVAFAAVNAAPHPGGLVTYAPAVLLGGLGLGLLVALLMASLGVLVSLRAATVKQAQQILALSVAVVGVAGLAGGALLPESVQRPLIRFLVTAGETKLLLVAGALLGAIDLLLLAACSLRFRRARLILD